MLADDKTTRGIGIYPGSPDECFAPTMVNDTTYRNLALNRRTWHSSSYDYNLTSQLVTDGYSMTKLGYWLVEKHADGISCLDSLSMESRPFLRQH